MSNSWCGVYAHTAPESHASTAIPLDKIYATLHFAGRDAFRSVH